MAHNILQLMTAPQEAKQEAEQGNIQDQEGSQIGPMGVQRMMGAQIGWMETGNEKGRGVFALKDIAEGAVIEVAPSIPVAAEDVPESGGAPDGYLLDWEPEEKGLEHCMPLGYIMLYNHSKEANIRLESDTGEMTITVFALRDIKAGEELTWDYSCDIWFDED
ncbi:MAG: SET domain-containing protein-lysine N-methyltransferase [Pseudomonadota bacterium]